MNRRITALSWFGFKSDFYKQILTNKYFKRRNWNTLTGKEIETLYVNENNLI